MTGTDLDPLNYTYMFAAERLYNESRFSAYMDTRWSDSCMLALVYVISVFAVQEYMRTQKQRYELRPLLVAWSSLLAMFSIIGTFRTLPTCMLVWDLHRGGLEFSCCDNSFLTPGTVTNFWSMLFTLSKAVELGDTLFIVLRKQPLIFLHWYHHVTVLMYTWYSHKYRIAGRWYFVMNYVVHSFMYTYYASRAMKLRLPRCVSMCITSLQLVQMAIGVAVTVITYLALSAGRPCHTTYRNVMFSSLLYLSYLLLFLQFFYTTYMKKSVSNEKKSS